MFGMYSVHDSRHGGHCILHITAYFNNKHVICMFYSFILAEVVSKRRIKAYYLSKTYSGIDESLDIGLNAKIKLDIN